MSINKTIHYCWFGRGKKSELINKCIESWKIHLPDYEIIEWNEDNFDITVCDYAREAYEAKKYAFVSDFARFYILHNHGGIYLDTDVEVIKSLDELLENDAFAGFESNEGVNPGLVLGSKKGNKLISEILDSYSNRKFIMSDGNYDITTVVKYTTDILKQYGLKCNNKVQTIENMKIYPKTYFCPLTNNSSKTDFSENTYTIHHFAGTWITEKQKKRNKSLYWKITSKMLLLVKKVIIYIFDENTFQNIKLNVKGVIK